MTAAAEVTGLAELRARLEGGVHPATVRGRAANLDFRHEQVIRAWPGDTFAVLGSIHDSPWPADHEPIGIIRAVKTKIQSEPSLLDAVLFAPHTLLDRLLDTYRSPATGPVDSWLAMTWTAEAAWCAITQSSAVPEVSFSKATSSAAGAEATVPAKRSSGAYAAAWLAVKSAE